jgi:hypothetical protein
MKQLPAIIVFLTVFAFSTTFVSGRGARAAGITGVVTEINTGYFMMTLDKGGMISKVYVTANTIFQLNGAKSDPSYVKTGVHVKLMGTSDDGGSHIEATLVNVIGGGRNKSKSE